MKKKTPRYKFPRQYPLPRNVPDTEWALALAIQAAQSRGLGFCTDTMFRDDRGDALEEDSVRVPRGVVRCCALGAMRIAGVDPDETSKNSVALGNDGRVGHPDALNDGYTLGRAYAAVFRS